MRKLENGNFVLETTTDIWPIVCCGTYDGQPCCYYDIFGSYMEDIGHDCTDEEKTVYADDFNFNDWKNTIKEELNALLDNVGWDKLGVGLKKVTATEIWSPSYYNFETDCAYVDVEVSPDFPKLVREKLLKAMDDEELNSRMLGWIDEYWKSRSGFDSFLPESWTELMRAIDDLAYAMANEEEMYREAQGVGCMLTLCCLVDNGFVVEHYDRDEEYDIDFLSDELREALDGNHSPGEYQSCWSYADLVERLKSVGVEPVDFTSLRKEEEKAWKSYASDGGSKGGDKWPEHHDAMGKLDNDSSDQDELVVKWALTAPGSQEEHNALIELRKWIDDWNSGRAA